MSSLTLRGIGHRYPDTDMPTLEGIDVEVEDGAMLAVVGPSGSGKSTLLRVTAGLEAPGSGTVHLDDRDVTALPPEQRELTVMFQQPHLFTHLDVLDNVAFGPRLQGQSRRTARATAAKYLDLVHLADLARRRAPELSGGQQQRVALARALATERSVLLLDEPFSSLDTELRAAMHDLLAEVRAALSPTVLMVTHDLDEAALADQVAVLVAGRFAQVGPLFELYARPANVTVARLLGGFNEVPGVVVDGRHDSVLGGVSLPSECTVDGPATLLLRREQLRLEAPDGGPASGSFGGSGSSRASGSYGPFGTPGRIVSVSQVGPRQVVDVETELTRGASSERLRIAVELPLGHRASPGERVVVCLDPGHDVWAVGDDGVAAVRSTRLDPAPYR